jgi:hypothetical protein
MAGNIIKGIPTGGEAKNGIKLCLEIPCSQRKKYKVDMNTGGHTYSGM